MTHVVLRSGKFIIKFYSNDVKAEDINKALAEAMKHFSDEAEKLGEYEFIIIGAYNNSSGLVIQKEGRIAIVPIL